MGLMCSIFVQLTFGPVGVDDGNIVILVFFSFSLDPQKNPNILLFYCLLLTIKVGESLMAKANNPKNIFPLSHR